MMLCIFLISTMGYIALAVCYTVHMHTTSSSPDSVNSYTVELTSLLPELPLFDMTSRSLPSTLRKLAAVALTVARVWIGTNAPLHSNSTEFPVGELLARTRYCLLPLLNWYHFSADVVSRNCLVVNERLSPGSVHIQQ